MIRPIKKMCSVMLAASLVWTAVSVPASANTQESENDSKWHVTDDIAIFVEPKYDDECCVWGEDEIAFVENGEWYEEANLETNIVFVDRDGIRTTISNDKGNGEQLFDEVYPMISEYGLSVMRLKKADKVAFVNFKGEFLGGKNMFYTEAHPITENLLRVTDDGVSYKIINKNGEVTLDNIKNIKEGWWSIIELNSIYI